MDHKNNFYLVLPSNVKSSDRSSFRNTTSKYRTYFPKPLELEHFRNYECALVEITFPQTFRNSLNIQQCWFTYSSRSFSKKMRWMILNKLNNSNSQEEKKTHYLTGLKYARATIPYRSCVEIGEEDKEFHNLEDLVNYLNAVRPSQMQGNFGITPGTGLVYLRLRKPGVVKLTKTLAEALGFQFEFLKGKKGEVIQAEERRDYSPIPRKREKLECSEENILSAIEQYSAMLHKKFISELEQLYYRKSEFNRINLEPEKKWDMKKLEINYQKLDDILASKERAEDFVRIVAETVGDITISNYNIFVYSNLVRETLVGDQEVRLLRTVPLDESNNSKTVCNSFTKLRYHPITASVFEHVDIQLTDDTGQQLKFKRGKVIVTLHIRYRKD